VHAGSRLIRRYCLLAKFICKMVNKSLECLPFVVPNSQGVVMANTAQARKRARQAVKQNAHNSSLRSELRTAIKKVIKAIEAGDKAAAQSVYQTSVSTVDSIADKKIIHKNKASRHKSRLSAAIKAMA
jgi:small subunit ribosomal protein S20